MQACQKKVGEKFLKHGTEIIYNIDGSVKSRKYYQLDIETVAPVVANVIAKANKCSPEATLVENNCVPTSGVVWKGKYSCPLFQGETELLLTMGTGDFPAIFEFIAKNGHGKYSMKGKYDPNNKQLSFEPTKWIEKPTNYTMIGMSGIVNFEDHTYKGKMFGCAVFDLKVL